MRVGASASATLPRAPAREVKLERTPVSRGELSAAIRRALTRIDGAAPSDKLVDTLTAHSSLETASGERMYNFNFAGIKGRSPAGNTAVARTREVLSGQSVEIRDGFRAYATIDEGAVDYVRTMRGRFASALAPAERGDVAGFAHALKSAGYYTAAESDYAKGLASLMGVSSSPSPVHKDFSRTSPIGAALAPRELGSLSSAGLARVESALDAGRFLDALSSSTSRGHRSSSGDDDDDF